MARMSETARLRKLLAERDEEIARLTNEITALERRWNRHDCSVMADVVRGREGWR